MSGIPYPVPPNDGRRRVVIGSVRPQVDGGRFAAKATVGRDVVVRADVFVDGHDRVGATVRWQADGDAAWHEVPMEPLGNDRWRATFTPEAPGLHRFKVTGWVDAFATWHSELVRRLAAGEDLTVELQVGAQLVAAAAKRAGGDDRIRLKDWAARLSDAQPGQHAEIATAEELTGLMARWPDRARNAATSSGSPIWVDRERAASGAWYELFPRSASRERGRHGTLRDVAMHVPALADLGFDVLYLPPIHPIGHTARKGPNNARSSSPGDVGSPWAIGSDEGGHTAVHPDLGTVDDVGALVKELEAHGMELALDVAFQCSPDHPWVAEHPAWFKHRPDGSIRFAENPPKKYEDVYPLDFETDDWRALWEALLGVITFWMDRGVRIFRVDNPHTKPFAFWEWLIDEVHAIDPGVIFLSEAFTRPRVMEHLAKLGFTQSYTYFAWRTDPTELRDYMTELTTPPLAEYMRPNLWPNTPDILTEELQTGGPSSFRARFLLAATLAANYGIYGPAFEHMEDRPREPGSEEYLHSDKYEIRWREPGAAAGMRELIARVNATRHAHPALQQDASLTFHRADNPMLLVYSKRDERSGDVVLVIVNMDHRHAQSGWTDLDMPALGLAWDAPFTVADDLDGRTYAWRGPRNFVRLDPAHAPGHLFHVAIPR
ncbi:MAG TPA: alpha-1,4-glucan--maltose-1-phosphate maltosyltransferase [Actinomycetota bacterium]|nr:alpha-1,4-glucan--maltose-1-phosphate maltosyltransferase [Actinomycetota bacterium]